MSNIHPVMERVLSAFVPGICEELVMIDKDDPDIAFEEPNEFEMEDEVGQCPECGGVVVNGVCQSMWCKSRLL